jgi:hypothetical protein
MLGQAITHSMREKGGKLQSDSGSPLDIAECLEAIRSIMENMATHNHAKSLFDTYGPGLFKCPRVSCLSFYLGFPTKVERDRHVEKHARSFHCTHEGCLATNLGFLSAGRLERHIKTAHKQEEDFGTQFPTPQPLSDFDPEAALEELDPIQFREYLQLERDEVLFFNLFERIWSQLKSTLLNQYHQIVVEKMRERQLEIIARPQVISTLVGSPRSLNLEQSVG